MTSPAIYVSGEPGKHNQDLAKAAKRWEKGRAYEDLSTICVVPTRGVIPARVVESWMGLINPPNNRFYRMFVSGMEVGDAYEQAVDAIMAHPDLSKWKYLLTLEEDNIPPADALLKLYENICPCKEPCNEHFSAVGGLYWTKGDDGMPMIYGNPKGLLTMEPQVPIPDALQECNGLGMGFTLHHMGLFRDKKLQRPWFKTIASVEEGMGTQDLRFYGDIRRQGYRVASDNRVRVGHYDVGTETVW